jgi:hypothetical protein
MHNDPQFGLTEKARAYLDNPPRAATVNPFTEALERRAAVRPLQRRFTVLRLPSPRRSAVSLSPAA